MILEFLKATLAILFLASFWMIVRSVANRSPCRAAGDPGQADSLGCFGCSHRCTSKSEDASKG